MKRVEGVKKLFLGALFAGQELDVIDQQQIDIAEALTEAGHAVMLDAVDQLIGELLAGNVADRKVGAVLLHLVPDGLHQVGLAHSHSTVEEQRVVGLGRPLGDCQRGGVRKLIAGCR